ncbi:ubx domain-containing [Lecanosticta acicola]|uniref:Ubx domain-containing n=1 Tax=Lecanosticta acicola TaxID=111012 RepID=A0AAI8W1N3_9PEZI|nr:ubx domain-containing [Lecanosticta acicola]
MFHDGDLQSGISRAISEGKLVACFIHEPRTEESRVWEEEWLGQSARTVSVGAQPFTIGDVFASKAVVLRLEFGSKEANFLNAFCPINKAPMFVVIDKGQVLEKVESGVGREEWLSRITKALGIEGTIATRNEFHDMRDAQEQRGGPPTGSQEIEDAATTEAARLSGQDAEASTPAVSAAPEAIHTPASRNPPHAPQASDTTETPQQESSSSNMSSLFPNRAEQMEDAKAKQEAAEKAERIARANRRRKEAEEAHAAHVEKGKGKDTGDAADKEKARRDWIVQQKKRKDEAKRDRERVLAQIEADKQERKSRFLRPQGAPSEPLSPSADAASKRRLGAGGMCSLQVRLFDGSSIKGRFEPSATLATNVRDWIKETTIESGVKEAADVPFTFKQILAPQPSRSIEISEEHQTVSELGLTPTATLVLVPISGYTEAYSGSGRGYMSSALHTAYGIASTASSIASSLLSNVPGFGAPPTANAQSASSERLEPSGSSDSSMSGSSASIKVKTLADKRAGALKGEERQAEFYNGNSSAFEGRNDDGDDTKRD